MCKYTLLNVPESAGVATLAANRLVSRRLRSEETRPLHTDAESHAEVVVAAEVARSARLNLIRHVVAAFGVVGLEPLGVDFAFIGPAAVKVESGMTAKGTFKTSLKSS